VNLQVGEPGLVRFDDASVAVKPQDFGCALKGAEQDHDAPVFSQVRDGLNPAAKNVEVGDGFGPEDSERVQPFGREVHVAFGGERRGGDEEHRLRLNEPGQDVVEFGVSFRHSL
jgi:hypothetical protein